METDSVPADKAADPAEETEWPKKQKLFETNNNRCWSDKKESSFKYYFVAKKFSQKNKKKMSAKCVDIFFAVVMLSIVVFLLFAPC